jgi:adenine-specific DNA-methyltransferase
MSIEFIGHKGQLLNFLLSKIGEETGGKTGTLIDLFCGTAAVSAAFARSGHRIIANDNLQWCSTFAEAALLNNGGPRFRTLIGALGRLNDHTPRRSFYSEIIALLNELHPIKGFFYRTYSPAAAEFCGTARMYFTAVNAGRIDAVRAKIFDWDAAQLLRRGERAALLRDLALAANKISNTAGTYGCYLKHWKAKALKPLVLEPHAPTISSQVHAVHCDDALNVATRFSADTIYADPPYTKRQYAAYYHVLETIARGDTPLVTGTTGLRPWKQWQSDFCHKKRAPAALESLIRSVQCRDFFLSYNEDGQIPSPQVKEILSIRGSVKVFSFQHRRYRSSDLVHKGPEVTEHLYHVRIH